MLELVSYCFGILMLSTAFAECKAATAKAETTTKLTTTIIFLGKGLIIFSPIFETLQGGGHGHYKLPCQVWSCLKVSYLLATASIG